MRTILSIGMIISVMAAVAVGTTAFFSDTESSTGNTFAAGAVDLRIDNESYYNGAFNEGTSWELSDLNDGEGPGPDGAYLFFNFLDLKPDDEGEDTISLHVDDNDAWACMNVQVTDFDDNGCNEPEAGDGDTTCGEDEGELQNEINFVWWADDGDNVLETDEVDSIFYGPQTLANLSLAVPLADSSGNGILGAEPLVGGETYYIGKAWCFGELTLDPVQEGEGEDPTVATGIQCDGTGLDNTTQTDSVSGDISFRAIQSRNNEDFDCRGECEINREETIIENSQFEVPEVPGDGQWDIFDSPAGGWNVAWRSDIPGTHQGAERPEVAHLEIHEGVVGTPFQGDQYAELDTDWDGPGGSVNDEPASVTIYQDVPTTPGTTYEISFAWAPRPNTPAEDNHLAVEWGGTEVYNSGQQSDPNPGIDWQVINIEVVATSTETQLRFTDLGEANSQGTFIDDIKLFSEVCVLPGSEVDQID